MTPTRAIHASGIDLLAADCAVHQLTGPADPRLEGLLVDADALIVRSTKVTAELIAAAPRLRVIGRHGAGTDNIDRGAADSRGITVVNTPRSNTESVAEYVITVALMLLKRIDGKVYAIRDRCLHRGVPLSRKPDCYTKDTITCWYHGYTYRFQTGELVNILAVPDSRLITQLEGQNVDYRFEAPSQWEPAPKFAWDKEGATVTKPANVKPVAWPPVRGS